MSSLFKKGIMGVGTRHTGKEKIKAQFDITIRKLTNISELNGKSVAIGWKRGTALHTGTTKEVVVVNGEASWNEKISVYGTMFRDPETDKFDEKDIVFTLKLDTKVFAKQSVDLSHYTKNEHTYSEEVQLSKKQHYLTLQISIHTRWLKVNGKVLIKQEDNTPREKAGIEIDGQTYGLRTDDALTDTSIDTGTGSWEEEDNDIRDDPFTTTTMYEAESRRTHDEMEALRKQLRLVEGESSQRAKTIELQEKAILELRRQLEILEKKCSENEELIERGYELESFMRQQVALAQQEHKDELSLVKSNHQSEMNALLKELETERTRTQLAVATEPPITPPPVAPLPDNDNNKVNLLESEKAGLQSKIDSLEEELHQSSLSLINMTDKLSEKDGRIESLISQIHTLQAHTDYLNVSLTTVPSPLQQPMSSLPKYKTPSNNNLPAKPLFMNPLLDAHHKYITLLGFLIVLSVCTLL